jgi:orotate phosphoribosyltransferase
MTAYKVKTKGKNLYLRVAKGHFATGRSHSNYFIDVTVQKSRLSEASALAKEIAAYYTKNTIVDTILCLDEMQVVGTCLADELTKGDFMNMNAHQTIYVVTPEQTSGNQLLFRDSLASMIEGKHVLILAASVNTGYTARAAIEAVKYYGGAVVGIASIFATVFV